MSNLKQSSSENLKLPIIIFTGDNLFSYILCKAICQSQKVTDIVISRATTNSYSKILMILRRTSAQYFLYRVFVQFLSKLIPISGLAKSLKIKLSTICDKADFSSFRPMNHFIGVTCNFDLIIPNSYIKSRAGGVLNIHASNLPLDRGISPVVWAFCRGDTEIYISYYLMDGGIDTGMIIKKEVIKINQDWSLFRSYCEVIKYAAECLDEVLFKLTNDNIDNSGILQDSNNDSYNSWPSKELNSIMKKQGRKYFKLKDIRYAFNLIKSLKKDT